MTFLLFTPEDEGWKKSLDKDDIVIYTRRAESSKLDEILAITKMEGSLEDFRRIITDIEIIPDWVPDCKSAEIIESANENDIIYRMVLKVPFPFSNRQNIQQLKLSEAEDELKVQVVFRPDKVTADDDIVLMEEGSGEWLIQKVSDKEISIRFQYFADPGGEIPDWLVNSFIVKSPFHSLQRLRKLLKN